MMISYTIVTPKGDINASPSDLSLNVVNAANEFPPYLTLGVAEEFLCPFYCLKRIPKTFHPN